MVVKTIFLFSIVIQTVVLHAQVIDITLNLPTNRSLSSLNDLKELAENEINVVMKNLTDQPQTFTVEVVMFSDETNFRIVTDPTRGVEIDLDGERAERSIFYEELKQLFYEESLIIQYNGANNGKTVKQFLLDDPSGQIPAGQYQLCVRLRPTTLNQQLTNSLSNTSCAFLNFEHYTAPLVTTIKGVPCQFGCEFEELPNPNEQIIVNFTASEFNDVSDFNYQIKIFEVTSGDFNQDFSAMQGSIEPNRYLYDQPVLGFVSGNTIVEPIAIENIVGEFELGKQYALVLQAKTITGELLPNDGFSQIVPFHFGEITEEETDPNLAYLPEECSSGDCNNIPLPTGTGTDVASISLGDRIRFGCFWVTVKEATASSNGFNGTGTVVLPFFNAKFLVAIKNAKIKKFDNLLVAIEGSAEGLEKPDIPTTGIVADVTRAFREVSPLVLNATGEISSTVQTAGGVVTDAATGVQTSIPYEVMQALYGPNVITETTEAVVDGTGQVVGAAIMLDQTANEVAEATNDFLAILGKVDRVAQQIFNPDFETGLPIGYSDGEGASALRFGIFGMTFTPKRAAVNLVVQTPIIPAINNRLYFGGSNITISTSDFSVANATFYLGGSIQSSLPEGHEIVLKGTGRDGEAPSGTYLKMKDGDLDEIMFNGEFLFSRELFLPKNGGTNKVKAILTVEAKNSFDDMIFKMNGSEPFVLATNKKLVIDMPEIFLDLSSKQNSSNWTSLPAELREGNADQQNAWTGIMVKEAMLKLPPDFKLGNSGQAPSIGFSYFMVGFNDTGVSFNAEGRDVITLEGDKKGSLAGFGFSIATINVAMTQNELKKFELAGQIKIGMFDIVNATRGGGIPYRIDLMQLDDEELGDGELQDFAFKIEINRNVKMEISTLHTAFTIGQDSYLSYNSGGHDGDSGKKIQFMLHGSMSIISEDDGLKLPEMGFQNFFFDGRDLKLDAFTVAFASPQKMFGGFTDDETTTVEETKAGGFPISLERFYPIFTPEEGKVKLGFGFDIVLNLKEGAGFSLTTGIEISTKLTPSFDLVENSFGLTFKRIYIDTDVSVCHVTGNLEFLKNDPIFGNGFRGCIQIEMEIPAPILGQVQGMFGSVKPADGNQEFRYFYIEGLLKGLNVVIPSTPIAIDGFAGGIAYNMRKADNAQSFAARLNSEGSGCQAPELVPDSRVIGISFGILVKEAASQGFSFNGMMSFEAEFNRETFAPMTFTVGGSMRFLKIPTPVPDNVPAEQIKDPVKIAADITLTYDFTRTVFYGNFNVYLDIAGALKGDEGPNGRAGRLAMYFGQDHWYIYVGNPWNHTNDPGNVLEGMGRYASVAFTIADIEGLDARAGAYLCMGTYGINGLPSQLPPLNFPADLRTSLLQDRERYFSGGSTTGAGIAFGAYLGLDFRQSIGYDDGDDYAKFSLIASAGAGFDVALVKYDNYRCGPNLIGINGYYAMGQVYGYVDISVRLKSNIGPDINQELYSTTVRAKLNFGAPNPTWLDGEVSIEKSALAAGGWVGVALWGAIEFLEEVNVLEESETIDFDVQVGDKCKPNATARNAAEDRQGSQSIVSALLPNRQENAKTILFASEPIRIKLTKPLSATWTVTKYNSNGTSTTITRGWKVKKAELKRGNVVIPITLHEVSSTELAYYVNDPSMLSNNQNLVFRFDLIPGEVGVSYGQSTFREYTTYANGSSTLDSHEQRFTVQAEGFKIDVQNVDFSYPISNQNYYLQGEGGSEGFIKLKYRNASLSDIIREKKMKVYADNVLVHVTNFEYVQFQNITAGAALKYKLPVLANQKSVRLEFFVEKIATESQSRTVSETSNNGIGVGISAPTQPQRTSSTNGKNGTSTEESNDPELIYTMLFKTSKYNSIGQKLASAANPRLRSVGRGTYDVTATLITDETFDSFEVGSLTSPINEGSVRPFVTKSQVALSTPWHVASFQQIKNEVNPNGFWAYPQPYRNSVVSLEENYLKVDCSGNEEIGAGFTEQRLSAPTAGTYKYTFYYEPPKLNEDGSIVNMQANTGLTMGTVNSSGIVATQTFSGAEIGGNNLGGGNANNNSNAAATTVPSSASVEFKYAGHTESLNLQATAVSNAFATMSQTIQGNTTIKRN